MLLDAPDAVQRVRQYLDALRRDFRGADDAEAALIHVRQLQCCSSELSMVRGRDGQQHLMALPIWTAR